jgi:hypothetical protein
MDFYMQLSVSRIHRYIDVTPTAGATLYDDQLVALAQKK